MKIKYDKWQLRFLNTKGDKILCCGRQVGKSVIAAKDAGDWSMSHQDTTTLMIAPVERQSFALFDKTLAYISATNRKMLKRGKDRPTKSLIKLTNGAIIWCLPVGMQGAGIRFLTVDRLYEDEASRIPAEVQSAVTPMLLTTGGDTIRLSTPFGAIGTFYDTWINKDSAYDSFTRFSIDSEKVIKERPICETWTQKQRDKAIEKIAREKARMTKLQFEQEYMGEFNINIRQVYSDKLIKECMTINREDIIIDKTRSHSIGIDVARMGDDESTFEIFDIEDSDNVVQVDNQITNETLTTETARHIINLNNQYDGFTSIFVDAYGMGTGVFDMLLDNDDTKRATQAIGHMDRPLTSDEKLKTRVLKEDIINYMLMMMESGKVKFIKDENIYESLKSYQFERKDNKVIYTGNYTHIADGMMRGVYAAKTKGLNLYVY